ncbi:MAG: CRISPR-associated helicase Cas3' [Campylobacteraceae bacterium]|jgi:CRISPR-associated endonuclease/helicase Cas3|nr:CRISPR-associated helicase Cas3' [Campylobacteraceae bacterium]
MSTTVTITPLSKFDIDEKYLAHTPNETLIEHANLTLKYFCKIIKAKNLEILINNLIKEVSTENFELIKEMFVNVVYLHDIGKKNPYFQANRMQNKHFREYFNSTNSSNHAMHSSDLYIQYYLKNYIDKIVNIGEKTKIVFILYAFSYQIAKHHGALDEFKKYRINEAVPQKYWAHLDKFKIPHFEFYILNKLLFSLLISSDYYATATYKCNIEFNEFGLFNKETKAILRYKFDIYKNNIKNEDGINKLRNSIYTEAQNNLVENINKNIFYLEAPTGSGKTITSINLALTILEKKTDINKAFYIFPFNTLVEQTKIVLNTIFAETLEMEVINSVTPIEEKSEDIQENEETKYNKAYVNRLFFHKPFIITTHVNFFNILFGTSKEDNFPLWQFANSIIILDEIQNYDNNLWMYMANFFDKYADLLNIKIIIMSATLPKLDYFLEKTTNFVDLISINKKKEFFQNQYFRNRVKIEYIESLNKITIDKLLMRFLGEYPNYKKILLEFIKKQTARDFFNLLIERGFKNVYELSGDDNKAYRHFVIEKSKENDPIIIVATQVIEAGIDIDMDIGFKDISTLDSEEQFMGRINRSCLKNHLNPKVYFFNLDNESEIYKGDNRLEYNLKDDKFRKILEDKDFQSYYEAVLDKIKKTQESFKNGLDTLYDSFEKSVKFLDYKDMKRCMTLIDTQTFTLYFPFTIDILKYKNIQEFKNINKEFITDGLLDGKKIWNKFLELNKIDNFIKKEVEKSKINSLMQFFTFNVYKYGNKRPHLGENMHGFFYIDDFSDFITQDGKFNRANFNKIKDCEFL